MFQTRIDNQKHVINNTESQPEMLGRLAFGDDCPWRLRMPKLQIGAQAIGSPSSRPGEPLQVYLRHLHQEPVRTYFVKRNGRNSVRMCVPLARNVVSIARGQNSITRGLISINRFQETR